MKAVWSLLLPLLVVATFAAPARADPDPQMPDWPTRYCPDGGLGLEWQNFGGSCNGTKYADGSYWRIPLLVMGGTAIWEADLIAAPMQCVVGEGMFPAPAPPGGCDGAVR
jgi:hypothetical protein